MRTHELEELQEEAHAAYHQGEYSTTINVLERVIEVTIITGMELNAAKGGVLYPLGNSCKKINVKMKDYVPCFSKISPWDPESRELRAECYIRMGDLQKAIQDLTPTTRLRNDNRAAFLKLSMLHYSLGEHHESLKSVGISQRSSSLFPGDTLLPKLTGPVYLAPTATSASV